MTSTVGWVPSWTNSRALRQLDAGTRAIPPLGFDDLSVDEKVKYLQSLWDRIAADPERIPVPEWHKEVLTERLEDHREWTPKAGAFSFGDLIRHLGSMERYMFAENAQGKPSRYPGHGRELVDGYDAVLAFFEQVHQQSLDIFRTLSPEDLQLRCETPGGASLPVWKWLRSMVEHEIHHRGQIYLMLNMLDVPTSPIYGLTSEQVHERSLPSTTA